MRGDIHRLRAPRGTRGSEQQGSRYAVVVQSDDLLLSTILVAPTSRSAMPRLFRPTITVNDEKTQVLIEQTTAVTPERLGPLVGHVSRNELEQISEALRLASLSTDAGDFAPARRHGACLRSRRVDIPAGTLSHRGLIN